MTNNEKIGAFQKDWILISIFFMMSGLCGYLFFTDYLFGLKIESEQQKTSIGRLYNLKNDVRLKSSSVPIWEKVKKEQRIFNRDQVFTGGNSFTVFEMEDGGSLQIGENTLFVVTEKNQKNEFILEKGEYFISQKSKTKNSYRVGETLINLSKEGTAHLSVSDKGKDVKIDVMNGSLEAVVKGKKVLVEKDKRIYIKPSGKLKIEKILVKTLSPNNQKSYMVGSSSVKVNFSWKSNSQKKNYRFELSEKPDFKKKYISQNVKSENFSYSFTNKNSLYYWRVGVFDGDKGKFVYSNSNSLFFKKLEAPFAISPFAGQEVVISQAKEKVKLHWEATEKQSSYILAVAKDISFKEIIFKGPVNETSKNLNLEGGQNYFWKVKSKVLDAESSFSEIQSFSVNQYKAPEVPSLEFPKPSSMVFAAREPQSVGFKWKKGAHAEAYQLQLSRDREFRNIVINETVDSSQIDFKMNSIGSYYWRVKSLGTRGEGSAFSEASEFKLSLKEPKALFPKNKYRYLLSDKKRKPFLFKWEPVPLAASYVIELSTDPSFSLVDETYRVDGNKFMWSPQKAGMYYWRVGSSSNSPGASLPSYSLSRSLVVEELPELVAPDIPTKIDVQWKKGY